MRQFLALPLPGELASKLARHPALLAAAEAGWRLIPAENLHLTLLFLGEVGAERDAASRERWRSAVEPLTSFTYAVRGLGSFPERGRPRVLWAGIDDEAAEGEGFAVLSRRLAAAAKTLGFPVDDRPFHPHVTLARAHGRGGCSKLAAGELPAGLRARAEHVVLFRSETTREGARYTALERFPLRDATLT